MRIHLNRNRSRLCYTSFAAFLLAFVCIAACGAQIGQTVISEPDEYSSNYEAKEKFILRAVARVFKEKKMGSNVRIDEENRIVETDFLTQNDWRTKSLARIKPLNWKESEVTLSVITEKRTESGWEMRRLLEKEQYVKIFDAIELKIYEEMYKME